MSTPVYPSWWSGGDTDAKINWLVDSHHARNYSEAASMLAKMRRPRRKQIDVYAVSSAPQEAFIATMERRKLF